jgi:hypothetical protein
MSLKTMPGFGKSGTSRRSDNNNFDEESVSILSKSGSSV